MNRLMTPKPPLFVVSAKYPKTECCLAAHMPHGLPANHRAKNNTVAMRQLTSMPLV